MDEKHKDVDATISVVAGDGTDDKYADEAASGRHGRSDTDVDPDEVFTPEEYKKLMRKVDCILMPMLMIIYGLQFSDKTSLSSGIVFGLKEDTGLTDKQFPNLTSFFYMAYAIAQYPMAFLLQRFPLGRALAVCCILWGAMVLCLGACNNYAQLAVVRTLLGWFESVVTPGFAIFTASWYLRKEQGLRQGLYYAMNSFFAMVFGVGIFYIARNAQQNGGLAAWRVINLFLGGVTVGMGIIFFIFGGTPDEVWWLSKREKRMAKARILSNATGGGEKHPWRWSQVRECFRDPQWYCAIGINFFGSIPNGALTTFQNLIFRSFGFDALETVLYSLPMYAVSFTVVVSCAIIVRYFPRARFPIAILVLCISMVVLLIVGLAEIGRWAKWAVWMFSILFAIASFIMAWPMISVNVAGRTKKSFFGASSLLAYCVGNIVGSQIFLPKDAPKYITGLVTCAVILFCSMLVSTYWWYHYYSQNKKRNAEQLANGISEEEREIQARINGDLDMTDIENRYFRYMH